MQVFEVAAGAGLIFAAIAAAARLKRRAHLVAVKLIGIAALAAAGASLLTLPVHDKLAEQRAAVRVGR